MSSPRYLALTNIRRRSQSLPAATEDKHRPPSTPNRARTIALPCPYRPFRCCIVIPSVDLGLGNALELCGRRSDTSYEIASRVDGATLWGPVDGVHESAADDGSRGKGSDRLDVLAGLHSKADHDR